MAELNYACIACLVNMAYHKATGLQRSLGSRICLPRKKY